MKAQNSRTAQLLPNRRSGGDPTPALCAACRAAATTIKKERTRSTAAGGLKAPTRKLATALASMELTHLLDLVIARLRVANAAPVCPPTSELSTNSGQELGVSGNQGPLVTESIEDYLVYNKGA